MTERPPPSAEGNLSRTPFAHVLLYVRERRLSGTLAVQVAEGELAGESLLTFAEGALTQVALPRVLDPLGLVLREQGAITDAQLRDSLQRLAAREGLQGEILVAAGACTESAVVRALRSQLRRKSLRLFALREAPYQYFDGVDLLANYGADRYPDDVLAVLWRGVRAAGDPRAVDAVLARVGANALRLRPEAVDLPRFEFEPETAAMLATLRAGPATVETLAQAAGEMALARVFAYVLVIAKQADAQGPPARVTASGVPRTTPMFVSPTAPVPSRIEPGAGSSIPPGARPSHAPAAAPVVSQVVVSLSPEVRARLEESSQRFEAMQDETYFQMLGVAPDASDETIRAAFLALAGRWHPDRAPEGPLRELHQKIFAQLNEAQETLCDAASRGRYVNTVQEGGGTPNAQRKIGALIEAATETQKAEVYLRRKDYDAAERAARRALAANSDDPTTLVVLAQALLAKRPDAGEAEGLLQRAITIAPQHDRALVALGGLYQRQGHATRALTQFRRAAEANPKNIDAARELRLATMRGQDGRAGNNPPSSPGDKPGSVGTGLWSKLLKR